MPFKRPTAISRTKVALSAIALACAVSAAAEAGPRAAPIVFKGDSIDSAAPLRMAQTQTVAAPPAQSRPAPADKATARIEFRYPDSSFADGQMFEASSPAPMANPVNETAYTEAPRVLIPAQPVVDAAPLQAMPELAGQGTGLASLVPAAPATQPVAAAVDGAFTETGVAIIYGDEFAGLPTANGEVFSQTELTAAHPSLPLPSLVQVKNVDTGREVVVRVNDRGPFEDGANLQLSRKAAEALGMTAAGKGTVELRYLSPAPVLASKPVSQFTAPEAPATLPASQPANLQMASAEMPAEDELLGGGPAASSSSPRLMSMTVAPKAASIIAPAAAGDMFVQLASFSDIGNAEALLRQVEGSLPVEIVPARVNGADFFRVRVGPFQDHASAEQVRASLSADGTADGRIVSGY